MKVARKSPHRPSRSARELLLERERKRLERERWIASANAHCTPDFCAESLRVNAEYPIADTD